MIKLTNININGSLESMRNLVDYVDWLENKVLQARYYFGDNIKLFSEQTQDDLRADGLLDGVSVSETFEKEKEEEN
jgi:hypothetical protein